MKILLPFVVMLVFLFSCKKENENSNPQITFKSLTPNSWLTTFPENGPILTFQLTDKEGDIGFQDTSISYIYIRRANDTLRNSLDSFQFPELPIADKSNLNVEVSVNINHLIRYHLPIPNPRDTVQFEFYVKDFANNKSNVVFTPVPFYYSIP